MVNDVLPSIILGILFLLPPVLIILDIINLCRRKQKLVLEAVSFSIGLVYMLLGWWLWDLPDFATPINLYGSSSVHEPFNSTHMPTLLVIAVVGFISYAVLRFTKRLPPLAKAFCIGGVYAGCAVCIAFMVQLLGGASPEGISSSRYLQANLFFVVCLCVVPALFLLHVILLFIRLIKQTAAAQEQVSYKNRFLSSINAFLLRGANLYWTALVLLIPLLTVVILILCLFGQQPDSVILAFTRTSDWLLSGEAAPPPVAYDTHYLCTVSLRGHKKLVRPLRYGIRRGEKIVVNRQLCIANAFEQLIEEKTPRFHRAVRNFYDTCGYPISRFIQKPLSADIVYLLMKPLEWTFVLILYLFDERPENRIQSQYLPAEWRTNDFRYQE